ncbi:hypothetical protein ACFPOI_31785 [Nonomuraea angiospora]|uniref:Uncharacterized protein n=1 Tax=Nonomuraea angiospora TaxID=46172 RepID=A0ABR9LT01_9ACTN|nr:hypothetical protein [Nonomuraea angiospora]MBE1583407.1 hypothetical protein [Nonomuraea angiospora]
MRLYDPDGHDADLVRRTLLASGAAIVVPGSPGSDLAPELLPPDAPPLKAGLPLSGEPQPLGEREVALSKPRWAPSTARGWRSCCAAGAWTRSLHTAETDRRPV